MDTMSTPETIEVKVTQKLNLTASDGKAITEGSVLINLEDGTRGVVTEIGRPGHRSSIPILSLGDIIIQTSPGCYRGTNMYDKWRHIPHNEQTYLERYNSWRMRPYRHDEYDGVSREEGCAINGIMALLRDDVVEWELGPWPDHIEDALKFLQEHLSDLAKQKRP